MYLKNSKKIVINDSPNAKTLTINKTPQIEFSNIRFAYNQDPIFDNFNLTIKPNERIGLVGKSGAGKSTLVNLLLRFYELDDGRIRINNQNIKSLKQTSLRSQISVVTQDNSLLHRSIKENIAYGRPDSSMEDIIKNARKRHKHVEVEVENQRDAILAASSGATIVMLDNFSPVQIKKTITTLQKKKLRNKVKLEASGGINSKNIAAYTKTGVDMISVGSITNSVKGLNLSLEVYV